MRNIKLTIEYDGTNYFGWQRQPNVISVQEIIEESIRKITNENIKLIGAGRTDKGVHARGQVANFLTCSKIPDDRFKYAINSCLPKDISIKKSERVDISFHSRYDACGKEYKYIIYNSYIRNSILRNFSYHIPFDLNFEDMEKAKKYFIGTHNFASFMSSGSSIKDTVRTIDYICLTKQDKLIEVLIRGNGFLYNMVRIIVGTLVDVGRGKIRESDIPFILKAKDRKQAGHTAPPQGLFLQKVFYM